MCSSSSSRSRKDRNGIVCGVVVKVGLTSGVIGIRRAFERFQILVSMFIRIKKGRIKTLKKDIDFQTEFSLNTENNNEKSKNNIGK